MEGRVDWAHLTQKLDGSGTLMSAVMNQWVPLKWGICRLAKEVFVLKRVFKN
jgi:hypothetical protein